jgi:predicted O-methyltransferase YrrM
MTGRYAAIIARNNPAQDHWELEQLLCEVSGVKMVLEIGTHQGGSARVFRDVFGAHVTTVDLQDDLSHECGYTYEDIDLILGRSQTLMYPHPGPYDLLFIDGGHHYSEVAADYAKYRPLVRSGGYVAFHDVIEVPDVAMLWEDIRAFGKTKVFYAGKDSAGTGTGLLFV